MNTTDILKLKIPDKYDPCFCGSGKKYKFCCMKNIKNKTWGETHLQLIDKNVFYPTEPEKIMSGYLEKILFIPYYNSLPSNIVNEIDELIKKYPIRSNGCMNNSLLLTLNIEGVETCKGYYYDDFETYFSRIGEDLSNDLKQHISGCEENGCRYFDDKNKSVFDIVEERVYHFHYWNVYNGIHFDITRELLFNYLNSKLFMGYVIEESLSIEDLISPKTTQSTFLSNIDNMSSEMSGSGIYENLIREGSLDLRPHKYIS